MNRVHERLARFEQTDLELPAIGVTLLNPISHNSVGILIDDRNTKRATSSVIENPYYEGRIRVIDIWTALECIELRLG